MKNKLLTLFLAFAASVGTLFAASGTCGTNLTWTLSSGTLTISGTGAMENYSAPWYSSRSSIKTVIIESGVTTIGENAFGWCSSLTSVTIPNSVTTIGLDAFWGCSKLTAVHISDIAAWCKIAFGDYAANPLYYAHNLYLNGTLVTDLVIPNSVTTIGYDAFWGCTSLTSVTIPSSVTSIGSSAFNGCSSLTSITIPNSVTSIGGWAFSNCSSLTSVTIPNSVTSIGYGAFEYCSSLTSITIPNSVTYIGDGAFAGCSGLTSIQVDTTHSYYCDIDGVLFSKDKKSLIQYPAGKTAVSYSIPNSVTSIGDGAFESCSSLTSVTIPNSVTSIGYDAFYNCTGLTSITCEAINPPTLGKGTFYNVDKSIPLYVPACSMTDYNTEWADFIVKAIPGTGATIVWKNEDGTVLEIDEDVPCDIMPEYNGTEPTKPADAQHTYTFIGWNPEILAVTGDATYTAVFEETLNTYTITWQDEDGNVIKTDEVAYGLTPEFTGTTPTKEGYDFAGWLPNIKPATEDTKYTTYFIPTQQQESKVYTVNINGENCSLNINNQYPEGTVITLEAVADECFEFRQWSDGNKDNPRTITVTKDASLTAEFNKVRYTITDMTEPGAGGKIQVVE